LNPEIRAQQFKWAQPTKVEAKPSDPALSFIAEAKPFENPVLTYKQFQLHMYIPQFNYHMSTLCFTLPLVKTDLELYLVLPPRSQISLVSLTFDLCYSKVSKSSLTVGEGLQRMLRIVSIQRSGVTERMLAST
jgi:hypothetical protein